MKMNKDLSTKEGFHDHGSPVDIQFFSVWLVQLFRIENESILWRDQDRYGTEVNHSDCRSPAMKIKKPRNVVVDDDDVRSPVHGPVNAD